jgi:hypothetical protein
MKEELQERKEEETNLPKEEKQKNRKRRAATGCLEEMNERIKQSCCN